MGVLGKGETQMGRKWMEKVVIKKLFYSLVQTLFCTVVKMPSRTFFWDLSTTHLTSLCKAAAIYHSCSLLYHDFSFDAHDLFPQGYGL